MPSVDAFFLSFPQGRRFCLLHAPAPSCARRGAMLYIHPFAEEMNKSRRMAAVQARALATAGWSVLQVDLFGCGDSDGDFGDADWTTWVSDVREAAAWLQAESGVSPALWGLRAGCLLAMEAAAADVATDLLLWQPVWSGRQYLRQFLRVKLAGQMIADGAGNRETLEQLQAQLHAGQTLEVGGYALSPGLAKGLDAAELGAGAPRGSVAWLEVGADADAAPSPATSRHIDAWRSKGVAVDVRTVSGLPFWQTQEIAECAALVESTANAIEAWNR